MKSIILSTILMALLFSSIICAGSTVNNDQEEFNIVQVAILQYQNDTNEFPTSWDDLWNNPASRPSVESLTRRRTDMIESFRFIASGTTIVLPVDGSTVIGMMTRPMRPPPDRKLRLLIVRLKDGTRRLKQIPEESLERMFSRAGFDLADYTGPDGNWEPETRLRSLSEIPRPRGRSMSDPSFGQTGETMLRKDKPEIQEKTNQPEKDHRLIWISGTAILAAFLIWMGIRNRSRR